MIDSHHHLWRYSAEAYPWIPAGSPLAQDRLLPDLDEITDAAGITGTIVVQARQILEESDFLLDLASRSEKILGVVGWVPLIDGDVEASLERLAAHPKFKGVRHVLQDEPDDYFLRADFHQGLKHLEKYDLRFDLLILQRQLPLAIQLVDRQPETTFIIDHLAKPEVGQGPVNPFWRKAMKEIAARENVIAVKFSGLLTEFPEGSIDPTQVADYFDETLNLFGVDRVMFGSDWPVALLRTGYQEWAETVSNLTEKLSAEDRHKILHGNAARLYRL
jgi:L-fuconolactonase